MESITKENPKKKDRNLVWGLFFALALSLVASFVLSNKLETMKENYDVLTREVRSLENKIYEERKKDVRLLEEARSILQECKAEKDQEEKQ